MPPTGPNTPDQLDLVQQMNKLLQDQNKILQQIAGTMGAQAQASQQLSQSNTEVSDSASNAADKVNELNDAMKENTGGAEGLAAAMGKQSQKTRESNEAMGSIIDTATKTVATLGVLSAGVSGLANAYEAAGATFKLFTGGLSAGIGIFKGATGVVGGFFSGLMQHAANYHNAAAGEMHQANESIRKEFGDITSDQGKFVKDMVGELGGASAALGAAGTSLFGTVGRSAAVLQEMGAIAGEFGESLVRMQDQIKGSVSEMFLMRKGMNISTEAFKNIASTAEAAGGSMQDALTETMVASSHLSKTFGVDVKVIGKGINEMAKDMASFGHLGPKALAATATYATKLGVSISALKGTMDAFDTFESAAANAGKLAEAFGMNVDVMGMMNAENPAERMDMLRKSFEETGKSVSDLSRHELKMLSDSMGGMPIDEMKNALSMSTDEMGFGDFEDAAEEAASKITPEEAMKDVAESIDRLATQITDLASGPLSNFMKGFSEAITRSAEFRAIMKEVGAFLKEFFVLGKAVGRMFVDVFLKEGGAVRDMISGIFSLEKIKAFTATVKLAFSEFFDLIKTDPKKAVENLFDKVFGAFKTWFGSGEQSKNLGMMLVNLVIGGFKMLAGLIPKIISAAAGAIRDLTQGLKDFLAGDKESAESIGAGIGDSIKLAFESIKSALPELKDALIDLFLLLFEIAKPHMMKVVGVVIAAILVKTIVSSLLAVGVSGLIGGALKKMLGAISKMTTGSAPKDIVKSGKSASKGGSDAVSGIGGILKALRSITIKDILMGGLIMVALAAFASVSMYIFAKGLKIASGVMKTIKMADLQKTLLGLTAAVLITIPLVYIGMQLGALGQGMPLAVLGMVAAAAMFFIGGVGLGYALQFINPIWGKLDTRETLKTIGLMALTSIAMLPLIAAGMLVGGASAGILLVIAGMVAATALFTGAAAGLGWAFQELIIPAWQGVDTLQALKAIGLMALVSLAMIPLVVGGAALGAIVIATLGGGLAIITAGFMLGTGVLRAASDEFPDAINYFSKAFTKVKLKPLGKAMLALLGTVVITGTIAYFGAALAYMSPLLLAAYFGVQAGSLFVKETRPYIQEMVDNLSKINIKNPKTFKEKMLAIGSLIAAVAQIADLGISAMGMATTASMFSDKGPEDMMKSISGFIGNVLDSMLTFITQLVTLASGFDEKSLKGAAAIADILGAVGTLAGALMEPLQNVQANVGIIDIMKGDGASKQIETMAAGMGTILEALAKHVPKIIDALVLSLAGVGDSKVFGEKAKGLKDIFEGILALMTVVKEMNGMGQKDNDGFFTGTSFDKTTITSMFTNVSSVLASDELKDMLNDSIKLISGITGGEDLLTKAESFAKILDAIVSVTEKLSSFGEFLRDGGMEGMSAVKWNLQYMIENFMMPSDIIGMINDEAFFLADIMKDMDADIGAVDLRPQVSAILGYDGDRTFTIKPDAVNLTVRLQVKVDAEELAVAIAKGNSDLDGFFQTTEKAQKADLDIPGGV